MSRRMLDYSDIERLEAQLKELEKDIKAIKKALEEANITIESESEE